MAKRLLQNIRDRGRRGRQLVALLVKERRAGLWRANRTEKLEAIAHRTKNKRDIARAEQSRNLLNSQRKKITRYIRAVHLSRAKLHHWKVLYGRLGPKVNGNHVTGGSARARLVKCAVAAADKSANGSRHSYYDQDGDYTVNYAITGEPRHFRSDCSQWFTSCYKACGLPDPNGTDYKYGNTATLVQHGKPISRDELEPGDGVIYGDGGGHHVEMYIGPGSRTIGHGSAPVDAGTIDMIGGPKHYRRFV